MDKPIERAESHAKYQEFSYGDTTTANIIRALVERLEQQAKSIDELVEALEGAADTFTWLSRNDFALTYQTIANKYKNKEVKRDL